MPEGLGIPATRRWIWLAEILRTRIVGLHNPAALEQPVSEHVIVVNEAVNQGFVGKPCGKRFGNGCILSMVLRKNRYPPAYCRRNKKPAGAVADKAFDRGPDGVPVFSPHMNSSIVATHKNLLVPESRDFFV
jgi:hypothetical protein